MSCDFEKYTGYKITGEELLSTTIIHGKITNYYTDEPVKIVNITFGDQKTITNFNGEFEINYLLSEEEKRNKKTYYKIQREGYYTIEDSTYLLPQANEFNFEFKYGSPIVEDAAWVKVSPEENYCQAIIKDYQGINSIVMAKVYLYKFNQGVLDTIKYDLNLLSMPDTQTGYYQAQYFEPIGALYFYDIYVKDNDNFLLLSRQTINMHDPDDFIF